MFARMAPPRYREHTAALRSVLLFAGFWAGLLLCGSAAAQDPEATPADAAKAPAPAQAPATEGIEEIVVRGSESEATSDFASADSVVGFGAEDLAALGAGDISDLAAFTPNLEIVTAGATTPTFFIRGVGLNDFNSNSTGAVAIYQDDVPRNAPALQLSTLFDIEQVSVLRGPQGTGLARNASAGAIKIYSRKPTGDYGAYLRVEQGNYGAQDYEGAVEAPLFQDILAGRFAFRRTERDGTMRNRCGNAPAYEDRVPVPVFGGPDGLRARGMKATDAPWSICGEPVFGGPVDTPRGMFDSISEIPEGLKDKVNNQDNWAARGTLLFQPTLDTSFLVNAHGARRDEQTRLGQAIPTNGFYTSEDGDLVSGLLGGLTGQGRALGGGYVPPEIRAKRNKLAPCNEGTPIFPSGNCFLPQFQEQDNDAKLRIADNLANNLDSEPWKGDFNRTGPTTNDTWGLYGKGEIVLPFGMQLTSITGYDTYDRKIDIDLDFSPETLFQIITDDDGWQTTQDLKLEGAAGDQSQLRWDVGGWFLREQLDVKVTNDLGKLSAAGVGFRDYTQDLYSAAGYATLAFDFWENFTLDGGFRYNWERKEIDYKLFARAEVFAQKLDDEWHKPTGTVRLTYRFREDTHAYWKYTRGWKPGTFNATSSVVSGISVADPESIDAFETGISGSWFQGRLGLDASFFYYNYTDYQIFTAQQFSGGQPEFVILNADEAEVYGVELDAAVRPWMGAFVNVRFGWLETQFLDFVQTQQEEISVGGAQTVVTREIQNSGNPLLNSPKFKVSITAEQTIPLGRFGSLTPRYDGVWTDVTYFDASKGRGIPNSANQFFLPKNTTAQPAFWLHNLRVGWRPPIGQMEIAGWVRNLANESYKTFAFDGSTFNGTSIYFVGDPRTYGATVTITF